MSRPRGYGDMYREAKMTSDRTGDIPLLSTYQANCTPSTRRANLNHTPENLPNEQEYLYQQGKPYCHAYPSIYDNPHLNQYDQYYEQYQHHEEHTLKSNQPFQQTGYDHYQQTHQYTYQQGLHTQAEKNMLRSAQGRGLSMGSQPAKANKHTDVNMDTNQSKITADSIWESDDESSQNQTTTHQRPASTTGNETHEVGDKQVDKETTDTANHQEVTDKAGDEKGNSAHDDTLGTQNETKEKVDSREQLSDAKAQQKAKDKTQDQENPDARTEHEKEDKPETQDGLEKQDRTIDQDRQSGCENPLGQAEKEKLKISTDKKAQDSPRDSAKKRPEIQAQRKPRASLEESKSGQRPPTPQTDNRQSRPKIPGLSNNRQNQADYGLRTRNDQWKTKPRAEVKESLNPNQQKSKDDTTRNKMYAKNQHIQEMDQHSLETASFNQHPGYGHGVYQHGQVAGKYMHDHSKAGYQSHLQVHGGYSRQDQMQEQIIREAQASKQMVYEVYGNCITMLEEMENRELRKTGRKAMSRSDIYLPDQSKFDDNTIHRKMDTQLILLQAQLTSCHDAIRDEVKDELKANTLHWSSAREAKKIPHGLTDKYAEKMFGLLETGTTKHPKVFHQPPTIDERGMQKALGAILHGNQKRADLDRSFKDDRNKKANGPRMRQSAGIDQGVDRLVRGNPKYEKAANNYRESLR